MSSNIEKFNIKRGQHPNYPTQSIAWGCESRVTALFDDLETHLVKWVMSNPAVVGCVAWFTNPVVIRALNSRKFSSVVMQKEDWLRPDCDGTHPAKFGAGLYQDKNQLGRVDLAQLAGLSFGGDQSVDRYRVFGKLEKGDDRRPLMHHKFLVGCDISKSKLVPQSVWTGSYNMTKRSNMSLENAVIIKDGGVADAYLREWLEVFALSESLNFDSHYVRPQWTWGS